MTPRIVGLNSITSRYKAILCDVWGVIHNGRTVYGDAASALANYRAQGGFVVLLTNSPRPSDGVFKQLQEMGVRQDAFDSIVTSGDVTRTLIKSTGAENTGGRVFHLGPDRDVPLFEGTGAELVSQETCEVVVCTGLVNDEVEKPEDYRDELATLAQRGVPFICANPDIVVERGEKLIFCAGSLAMLYEELGGKTLVAGKPHVPIYATAMERLAEIANSPVSKEDVLAIGDGMPTDVAGALNNGFDLLYISAGIHHSEYGGADDPDPAALDSFLTSHNANPTGWMPRLVWDAG